MSTDHKPSLTENPDMEKKYPTIPTDYPTEEVDDPMLLLVWKPVMLMKTNYNSWKVQLDLVSQEHRVYDVATGRRPYDQMADWLNHDCQAVYLISQRIPAEMITLFQEAYTAYDKLTLIEIKLGRNNRTSPAYALRSMFKYKWDEKKTPILDFYAFIEEQAHELHHFRGSINDLIDLIQAMAILHALPESWTSLVAVILSSSTIDKNQVTTAIRRYMEHNITLEGSDSALALRSSRDT